MATRIAIKEGGTRKEKEERSKKRGGARRDR